MWFWRVRNLEDRVEQLENFICELRDEKPSRIGFDLENKPDEPEEMWIPELIESEVN